jgi:hypothetical protein
MKIGFRTFATGSLVAMAFFATGCHEEPSARTDEEMKERILGTWVLDDGPLSLYYMEKTYSPDGTSTGFFINRQTGKRIDFTSRWEISNGCLTGHVVTSGDPTLLVGATYSNKIIKMTDKRFWMVELGTGRLTIKHRKGRFGLFD